jgi:hypothetical protein
VQLICPGRQSDMIFWIYLNTELKSGQKGKEKHKPKSKTRQSLEILDLKKKSRFLGIMNLIESFTDKL